MLKCQQIKSKIRQLLPYTKPCILVEEPVELCYYCTIEIHDISMLPESIFNKNLTFTAGQLMQTLAKDFLAARGLSFFTYSRVYKNNNTFILTTHPEMSEGFYRNEFYHDIKYDKSIRQLESSALLWMALGPDDQKFIAYMKEYHQVDNGIVLTKQYDDFFEFCYFGAPPENTFVNNYYLSHLDELYNFCFYFKEVARDLIQDVHENPIYLGDYQPDVKLDDIYCYDERQSIISIRDPMFKKLYHDGALSQSISRREFQCLSGLATGQRIKNIANELNLTERSIRYYIENLKNKTGLSQQAQLVQFYHGLF